MNKVVKKVLALTLMLVSVFGFTSNAFADTSYFVSSCESIKQKAIRLFFERELLDFESTNIIGEAIQLNSYVNYDEVEEFSMALGMDRWLSRGSVKGANRLLYTILKNDISLEYRDIYRLIDLANQERMMLVKAFSRNTLGTYGYGDIKSFLMDEILIAKE